MGPRKRKAAADVVDSSGNSNSAKKNQKPQGATGKVKLEGEGSATRLLPFGQLAAVSAKSGRSAAASSSSASALASTSGAFQPPLPFTIQPSVELLEALRKDVDDLTRKIQLRQLRQQPQDDGQELDIPPFSIFLTEWSESGWDKMGLVLSESRPGRMEALNIVNHIFCERFARLGKFLTESEPPKDGEGPRAQPPTTTKQTGRMLLHAAIISLYALYALHAAPIAKAANMVEPAPSLPLPVAARSRSARTNTRNDKVQDKGKQKEREEDDGQQFHSTALAAASDKGMDVFGCISLAPIATWAEVNLLPRIRYQHSKQAKGRAPSFSAGAFPLPAPDEAVPTRIHPDEGRIQVGIGLYSDVILRLPDLVREWFPSARAAERYTGDGLAKPGAGGPGKEIEAVDEMTFILLTLCGSDHGQGYFTILMSPGANEMTQEPSSKSPAHNLSAAQQAAAGVLGPLYTSSSTFEALRQLPSFVGGYLVVTIGEGHQLYLGLSRGETVRWTATERSCPSPEFLQQAVKALLRDRATFELTTESGGARRPNDKDKAAAETAALKRWAVGDVAVRGEPELWVDLNLVVEAEREAAKRARQASRQALRAEGDGGSNHGMAFTSAATEITFAGSLARQLAGDQRPSTSSAGAEAATAASEDAATVDRIDEVQDLNALDRWSPPQNVVKGRFVRLPDSVFVGAKAQADDIMTARHRGQNVGDMLMAEEDEGTEPALEERGDQDRATERSEDQERTPMGETPAAASPAPAASTAEIDAYSAPMPEGPVFEDGSSPPRVRTVEAPWAGTRLTSNLLQKLPRAEPAERESISSSLRESVGNRTVLAVAVGTSVDLTTGGSKTQTDAMPVSGIPARVASIPVSVSPMSPSSTLAVAAGATPEAMVIGDEDAPARVRTVEAPWAGTRLTSTLPPSRMPRSASAELGSLSSSLRESDERPSMLSLALGPCARLTPGVSTIRAGSTPASSNTESHNSTRTTLAGPRPARTAESSGSNQQRIAVSPARSEEPLGSSGGNDEPLVRGRTRLTAGSPRAAAAAQQRASAAAVAFVEAELDNTLEDVMVEARRRTVKVLERTGLREV